MTGADTTRFIEIVLGILGVVLVIGWLSAIGFMFTVGGFETPIVLLVLTALGLVVIWRNATAA